MLFPSQVESKYDKRAKFRRETPSAGKRRGVVSGWQSDYYDAAGTPRANLVVYVYRSDADALAAYKDACPTRCVPQKVPGNLGIRAKYTPQSIGRTAGGGLTVRCVAVVSVRQNVYAAVVSCAVASYPLKSLAYDGGYLIGLVHKKAQLLS